MKRLVLPLLLAAAFAHADSVVFEDNFEGDLAKWVGQRGDGSVPMNVTLIDDPLKPGNKVARFDKPVYGGDIFTKQQFPEGKYVLSFDYLGTCGGNCGGVIGVTAEFPGRDQWLAGTANSGFPDRIKDTGKWEHYDLDFKGRFDFHLALEQWTSSAGAGKDIYFDNIKLVQKGDAAASAGTKAVAAVAVTGVPAPKSPQLVGYFPAWAKHNSNYWVKDVDTSGAAKRLTVINYAFGNVKDNRCVVGVEAKGVGAAADDYWDSVPKEHTLDGKVDQGDKGLFGHWNQLKQLKKANPNLKVVISLGGWSWSKYFSDAALPQNREAFVKSCVDAYIKGNVPDKQGKLVNGLAAGVFDGIDVDWEYPAAEGEKGNIVRKEDTKNYTALLAEFRKQLDAVKPGLLLTIATPAASDKSAMMELDKIHPSLDFINIMTYDFSNGWGNQSQPHANLYGGKKDQFAIDYTVKDYLDKVPSQKLVVGVPFYGYGWMVKSTDNNGMYQPASGPAKGPVEQGSKPYAQIKTAPGQVFRDDKTRAVWKLNGNEVWNYDDPQVLQEKVEFVKKNKLGGVMFWELSNDTADGELSKTLADALKK
ncbi:glycoside hydrolase family 18 protein [Jeongeupia wiesaeckerbachi]|uniref:glycoside hydrolase family 18 protein n=1 Tax=Jeongeupia wiesaeckerbachi TaxID=3051218 RepID=UPI003D8052E0